MEYVLSMIGLPQNSLRRFFSPLLSLARHIHDHFIPHPRNNYRPYVLGHRALGLFSGLLVAVKIFTLAVVAFGPIAPAFSSAISIENIISLTNESRSQFGDGVLGENSLLDKAAQAKADDMLAKGYFAHNSPDGRTPWDFITKAGYSYLMAGENLAVNFTEAENVETAWMNSPGHKANILNKNFQDIGIGISQGEYQGHTAIFVVQEFGTPAGAGQRVAMSNKPTQVSASPAPAPVALGNQVRPAPTPAPTIRHTSAVARAPQVQPKTLGDNKNAQPQTPAASPPPIAQVPAAALTPAQPQPVSLQYGNVNLSGQDVVITAQASGPVVKVVAYFGEQAVMLMPKDNGLWQGEIAVSALAQSNQTVKLRAFGMDGQTDQLQLADFSTGTVQNYNLAGTTPTSFVNFLGHTYDPKSAEGKFYLLFIAGILTSLIIAVGVKRHIQHLSLIANSGFVVIFATLMWWVH